MASYAAHFQVFFSLNKPLKEYLANTSVQSGVQYLYLFKTKFLLSERARKTNSMDFQKGGTEISHSSDGGHERVS